MTPQAEELHFRPKSLEQKALSYLHFTQNRLNELPDVQGKVGD